jgi:hypothetical protein
MPEVDDKSIIMFFKKGLRDSFLIRKLSMKNLSSSKEMLAITNKYSLAEEVTLDSREDKKDKELSQSDRLDTSKNNDKNRKHDHSVASLERLRCNRTEYQPRSGEFKGFLDGIYILHPRGNTRLEAATDCKVL